MAMGLAYMKCLDGSITGTQASSRFTTLGKHRGFWMFLPSHTPTRTSCHPHFQAPTAHCPSSLRSRAQEPESHPSFNISTHSVFPSNQPEWREPVPSRHRGAVPTCSRQHAPTHQAAVLRGAPVLCLPGPQLGGPGVLAV